MKKIILDTNFLLIPGRFKVDIFSEIDRICFGCKLFIIDKTIDELKKIVEKQKGKDKAAAKLGLLLVKDKKINIIETKEDKSVDDLILSLKGYAVATQDKLLKDKLRKKDVSVVSLRQKRYLVIN